MTKLDKKDKKLLFYLDENARYSNLELSKKIGLSKDAIAYRINRLKEQNIIKGYRTLIDWRKLGLLSYRIGLELVNTTPDIEDNIMDYLHELPGIWGTSMNDGVWDISFLFHVKDPLDLYKIDKIVMKKFRTYIAKRHITQVLHYEDLPRTHLIDQAKSPQPLILTPIETNPLDALDWSILQALSKNAREKLITMAQQLQVSSMLIHQRIKKLEQKKIILGYKAYIEVLNLGKDYYGVKINLNSHDQYDTIIQHIRSLPETTAMMYTVGPFDTEFDLEVEDSNHYRRIIEELKTTFPFVRKIHYLKSSKFKISQNYLEQLSQL